MYFINNAEMAALSSEGWNKKVITSSTENGVTETIIYCGKSRLLDPDNRQTELDEHWKIKKTRIVSDATTTTIIETWAEGSWFNRENLTYKYL